ncbi:MAG: enoyl-CoA hydratase [Solirubrobacteraceae bacterium]|nr:enoyl-CoA hydratase [Solirubrobacteraceae bacterium]
MAGQLTVEADGAVATVTLDRPEKRNALSIELREEMAGAFAALAADERVACVVLTGAGTAFCAGMDVTEFGGDRANKQRLVDSSLASFGAVARFPKPLVAAVNGPAIAGGFVLALHADVRVAGPAARFGFSELPRGIPPSYAAALGGLPEPVARELCLTGRLMDAAEALRHGLVTEVVPDGETVARSLELARTIASHPLPALIEVKRRALLAAEHARAPLFADEERVFRDALLGESAGA